MANITVSVPDDVYRAARISAAEKDTSVSAMVADYLRSVSDAEFARLEAQQKRVIGEIKGFRAGDRLSREELYDRAAARAEADAARERAVR